MNTGDVVMGLAKAIDASVGSAFPWGEFEEVLQERAKGLFDAGGGLVHYDPADPAWDWEGKGNGSKPGYDSFEDMWEEMKSGGLWYRPVYSFKDRPDPFRTSSGKFEFCSPVIEQAIRSQIIEASEKTIFDGMTHKDTVSRLVRLGEDLRRISDLVLMGHYAPLKPEVEHSEYPLLVMPYEMINLASGWIPNPPFLYKTIFETQLLKNESFAEINPKTAEQNGLKEGDRVLVTSPAGQVQVRVNLFEGAMPGVIYLPLGFGHTAYDEFLKGKGVNANDIIQARKDPLSGHMVWWNTPAKIMKV
jgi:anaerobic selenocysteine-containing dehydrogenase